MEYRPLGRTDLKVSALSLGTMTFGEQNSEAEAHEQLDMAVDHGVNFLDAAEMYPIPPSPDTQGRTEQYIGSWLKARGNRDNLVIATKVVGRSKNFAHLGRGAETRLDRDNIEKACEGSLRRLGVDCIDLYYTHWPERNAAYFGALGYDPAPDNNPVPIEETLEAMDRLIKAGKVRHMGVSNETAWGVMEHLKLSETQGAPRIAAIQNPYSLLNRSFECGLAEPAIREAVGLCAYSILGFGMLTGKYLGGAEPEGARLTRWKFFQRYRNPRGEAASRAYVDLARRHDLDPAQMAIAYVAQKPFVTSAILGATTTEQLKRNLDARNLTLSREVLDGIEAIHADHMYPCP